MKPTPSPQLSAPLPQHRDPVRFVTNHDLETLSVEGYRGVPVSAAGGFINLEHPFYPYFRDLWTWQRSPKPHQTTKKTDTFQLPVAKGTSLLQGSDDCFVWLGHASYYLRMGGVSLLIDPVLGDLNWLIRRKSPFPIPVDALRNLDFILVSHDHRDHCDEKSLRQLAKQNPRATVLTGLSLSPLLRRWMPSNVIQEAAWFQRFQTPQQDIEIWYLPTRHWCRRGLTDINQRLWGAFLLKANGKTVYWGGDTGWGSHFAQIPALFGPVDVHLAGIGAYQPEWFMHPSHLSPADAVRAGEQVDSRMFVPMHYGTFDLSDEPIGNPIQVLQELLPTSAFLKERLRVPAVGEKVVF